MSPNLIPASVKTFVVANPGIVHGALVLAGVVFAGALIIGATRFGLKQLGVIS